MWQIIKDNHRKGFLGYKIISGLIEVCKWRRNKEKLKKYVVDTNYYYGPTREEEEDYYVTNNITDKNDYYEPNDE